MKRQTYKKPYEWVVVDDGPESTLCTMGQKYIRGPVTWYEGHNTQRGNMDAGLKAATGDKLLFIEDDEYISPDYLSVYADMLNYTQAVGEACAKYYHIGMPAFMELHNQDSASLTQTGIRRELIPLMDRAVNSGEFFFDIFFWKKVHKEHVQAILFYEKNLLYGMKGLPGRHGLGGGHDKNKGYMIDQGHTTLKKWLGVDAQYYIDLKNKIKPEKKILDSKVIPNANTEKQTRLIWEGNRLVSKPRRQQTQMQVPSGAGRAV